jgi:hypothetical protein
MRIILNSSKVVKSSLERTQARIRSLCGSVEITISRLSFDLRFLHHVTKQYSIIVGLLWERKWLKLQIVASEIEITCDRIAIL